MLCDFCVSVPMHLGGRVRITEGTGEIVELCTLMGASLSGECMEKVSAFLK